MFTFKVKCLRWYRWITCIVIYWRKINFRTGIFNIADPKWIQFRAVIRKGDVNFIRQLQWNGYIFYLVRSGNNKWWIKKVLSVITRVCKRLKSKKNQVSRNVMIRQVNSFLYINASSYFYQYLVHSCVWVFINLLFEMT